MKTFSIMVLLWLVALPADAAWLVIRWTPSTHGNVATSDMVGDVVEIYDFDPWGLSNNLSLTPDQGGRYIVLNVPDKDANQLIPYVRPFYDTTTDPSNPELKYYRRYQVRKINLPTPVENTLNSTGRYTVSWEVLANACNNGHNGKCWYDKELDQDVTNP